MPKGIDPKAYAARVTKAKKVIAAMDPAMKKKLEQYYPKITKEDITKQMIGPKTTLSDMEKRIKANPTATPKSTAGSLARRTSSQVVADRKKRMTAEVRAFGKTSTASKATKTPAPKFPGANPAKKKNMPKPLTGPAAVRELQRQVSPAGVKKAEANAKKAIAKKYPDLTKKKK